MAGFVGENEDTLVRHLHLHLPSSSSPDLSCRACADSGDFCTSNTSAYRGQAQLPTSFLYADAFRVVRQRCKPCCRSTGGGAEAHAEGGLKTGRQADPAYKQPDADQPAADEPLAPTAGFAGELPVRWLCWWHMSRLHPTCAAQLERTLLRVPAHLSDRPQQPHTRLGQAIVPVLMP